MWEHFIQIAADQMGNAAKSRESDWVRLPDAKLGIDHVDAERRVVKQSLELLCAET